MSVRHPAKKRSVALYLIIFQVFFSSTEQHFGSSCALEASTFEERGKIMTFFIIRFQTSLFSVCLVPLPP